MKKLIAVALALTMTLSPVMAGRAVLAGEQNALIPASVAALPYEEDHGFTLTDTSRINVYDTDVYFYTHDKTGARVVHVANEDKNRSILVGFDTPALDDKGIPHIFEHITLEGNDKYPSHSLFFALIYQSYNTYMNATTGNSFTNYLYGSMSEEQLLLLTDYYVNATLYPTIYNDPVHLGFKREAWHYELADKDAPLNVTGVVYNEIKGGMDIHDAAEHHYLNALYPGSVSANYHGGNPEDILTLTYQEFQNFHTTYYRPSNCTVILYGDLEIERFLQNISYYFNDYEKEDIYVEKGWVKPIKEPVTAVFEYPMESDALAENSSVITYAVDLGRLSLEKLMAFDVLASVLNTSSSPFSVKMRNAFPMANISCEVKASTAGACLVVNAAGVNKEDMDDIKNAVNEVIAEILTKGFGAELVESVIAGREFSLINEREDKEFGVNLSIILQYFASIGYGYDYFNTYADILETAKDEYEDRFFENLIEEHIIGNPRTALIATVPAPGLREELDAEFRAELDGIKENMSDEEIEEIIAMNEMFAAINNEDAPAEVLESLTAVTVDTLPVELAEYVITDEDIDGLRVLTAEAPSGGVNMTALQLNSSAVTVQELHYLKLYASLLTQLPTENYELTDLQTKISRYLPKLGFDAVSSKFYDHSYQPVFASVWHTLNDDYEQAAELIQELLLRTDLTDLDAIAGIAGRMQINLRNTLNGNGVQVAAYRALANRIDSRAYTDYMDHIPFYNFLKNVPTLIEADPEGFAANLETVRDKLIYKDGSSLMFAGNSEGLEIFGEHMGIFTEHLQSGKVPAADYTNIPRPAASEGIIIDSAVQYNVAYATLDELGLDYNGKLNALVSALTDSYLMPEVRYTIGAYSTAAEVSREGVRFYSYRDPAVTETYSAFEKAAEYAANISISQEDMDRYIVSFFASNTVPKGILSEAMSRLESRYQGYPDDYKRNELEEVKAAVVDDFGDFARYLELLNEVGGVYTAGGQSAVLANAELFDAIVYAFGEPGAEE